MGNGFAILIPFSILSSPYPSSIFPETFVLDDTKIFFLIFRSFRNFEIKNLFSKWNYFVSLPSEPWRSQVISE